MTNRLKSLHLLAGWAWLALVLGLCAYNTHALVVQNRVQFDLMALLPEGDSQNMTAVSQLMADTKLTNQVILMMGHPNAPIAKEALNALRQGINETTLPLKEQNALAIAESYHTLFKTLHPHRAGFLSNADRNLLLKGEANGLLQRALSEIFTPFSTSGPLQIKEDPFFLYPHFIKSTQPESPFQLDDQGNLFLESEGITWYLYKAHLTEAAFSLQVQEKIAHGLTPILDNLEATDGLKVLRLGAVFYAEAGAKQAQGEVSSIGVLSFLGIILMLLVVFKTLRPLALAISVITTGIIGGLAACLAIFGSIHILAFVFGCSLVGITVDYALHYFCASYTVDPHRNDRFIVLKGLMPALPLGVLSSCLGYGLLIFVPFPGIQQMAVLACVGLLCAFLSVCVWGPYFIKKTPQTIPSLALKMQGILEKLAKVGHIKGCKTLLTIVVVGIVSLGGFRLVFDDDIRSLQSLNVPLKSQEETIKSMMHWDASTKFLSITGTAIEDILQREETLIKTLEELKKKGIITGYQSLATLIPSVKRQGKNRHLVETKLLKEHGGSLLKTVGYKQKNADAQGESIPYILTPEAIDLLPEGWRELIHLNSGSASDARVEITGRILLKGVTIDQELRTLTHNHPNVSYIDTLQEYESLFRTYRMMIIYLIFTILFGIIIFVSMKKNIEAAFKVVTPVSLSLLATVGILGLCQVPFNLFHGMGLLLVLCIGIDYGLFLYWQAPSRETKKDLILLANGLAAVTTLLSFGLLALSQTGAVHSFGLAVFVGITLSFLLTTMFLGKNIKNL